MKREGEVFRTRELNSGDNTPWEWNLFLGECSIYFTRVLDQSENIV